MSYMFPSTILDNKRRAHLSTPLNARGSDSSSTARDGDHVSQRRRGIGLHRAIWISDVHLGTKGCKAELLLDFLKHNESETLYLVGDIFDGWRLARSWFWQPSHSAVVDEILRKARSGTRVVYVPGNHDEALRSYCGLNVAGIEILREAQHATADGRKLLVLHGDQFDGIVSYARWLAVAGDHAYALALQLNDLLAKVRQAIGMPYWSLSRWLKYRVKNAVAYITRFEEAVSQQARERQFQGVVCGHIHHAEIRMIGDVLYCNDGDWVESCSALSEDHGGRLRIINWTEEMLLDPAEQELRAAVA